MFNYIKSAKPVDFLNLSDDDWNNIFFVLDDFLGHKSKHETPKCTKCAYNEYTLDDDKNTKYIEIQVPGFSKDEIDVTIEEGVLKVKAHQAEKTFSNTTLEDISFTKKLENPDIIVTAECTCGILRLRLEIPEKKENIKKIEIL